MNFNLDDCMDVTSDLNTDLSSVQEPRWLRKQRQQNASVGLKQNNNITNVTQIQPQTSEACRFIPRRRGSQDIDVSRFHLLNVNMDEVETSCTSDENKPYTNALEQRLFDTKITESKILTLTEKAPAPAKDWRNELRVLYTHNKSSTSISQAQLRKNSSRYIPQQPFRELDAPNLVEDYYLNLLDWSSRNEIAVALGEAVYLWNAESSEIKHLMTCPQADENNPTSIITSLSWTADGNNIAIGTSNNDVQIWDANRAVKLRTLRGHSQRPGSLSWNQYLLSTGGKDGRVINHDTRIQNHILTVLQGHTDFEVCGLKWSHDGTQLASGGNDNVLNIWSKETCIGGSITNQPKFQIRQHTAAVKALAWCPWQNNLLASGGGTSDRRIMFWNTTSGNLLNSIDTKSQVCSLVWSKHDKEIVSSHGFSQNQLCVWKYPSLTKSAELMGHTSRVLHMAQSPDGATVVSAAGESMKFWKVFSSPQELQQNETMIGGARKEVTKNVVVGNMRNIR